MRFGLSDLDELPSLKEFEALAREALGTDEGISPTESSDEALLNSPNADTLENLRSPKAPRRFSPQRSATPRRPPNLQQPPIPAPTNSFAKKKSPQQTKECPQASWTKTLLHPTPNPPPPANNLRCVVRPLGLRLFSCVFSHGAPFGPKGHTCHSERNMRSGESLRSPLRRVLLPCNASHRLSCDQQLFIRRNYVRLQLRIVCY